MLGNFACFFVLCGFFFFKLTFFKKTFQEYHQCIKQFGSRSGPTFCRGWSGSKLFAKVISRRKKSPLAGKVKNCWMSSKQCRPWSDAAFCSIWSGSTLFLQACLSQYLGLLWHIICYSYIAFLVASSISYNLQGWNILLSFCKGWQLLQTRSCLPFLSKIAGHQGATL